jgi:diacylglycerol O-acyltransferase
LPTVEAQTLSPADLAWLRVQTPENLPITTVVLISGKPLDDALLKARIEDRLLAEPKFRQRVASPRLSLARPHWQSHDEFQLDDHFIRRDLASLDDRGDLEGLLRELRSRPFDESLPLWQIHSVRLRNQRSALVVRLHAALADPHATLALTLRLTDLGPGTTRQTDRVGFEHRLPIRRIHEHAGETIASTRTLSRLIATRSDPDNPLRLQPIGSKRLACSDPLSSESLRKSAARCGVSMSEMQLAAVAAALRSAIQSKDQPAEDVQLRALVPVSIRQPDDPATGTRLAFGLLSLPLGGSTSTERLTAVRQTFERFELASDVLAILGPQTRLGLAMTELEERSLRLLGRKATVMLSAIDGPSETVTLGDQPVTDLLWWPAELGEISLGVGISSYAGRVRFCVSSDDCLGLDSAALAHHMASVCQSIA